jgi:hypothetical protein
VDEFLRELSHPLKAEVEAVRSIIKGVNKDINEESNGKRHPSITKASIW